LQDERAGARVLSVPEGDTIYRLAARLREALVGERIERAESHVFEVQAARLEGAEVVAVDTHGKNLLIELSTGLTLHTHLMMHGAWHIYARDAAWTRARSRMRVALATASHEAVCFAAPVVRLVKTSRTSHDARLAELGPDPLRDDYDRSEVLRRLAKVEAMPLGVALLDQRVVAGVGNVLKSETIFLAGADPFAPVALYDEAARLAIVELVERVLRLTVERRQSAPGEVAPPRFRTLRRTTRAALGAEYGHTDRLWVYSRRGQTCYVCGSPIAYARQRGVAAGASLRSTYSCPSCQPERLERSAELAPPRVGVLGRTTSPVAGAQWGVGARPWRSRCR
jgi:endonuclease VIII